MRVHPTTASLAYHGNTLKICGKGPISVRFGKRMAKRLLELPSHPDLIWYAECYGVGLTAFDILSRLSKDSFDSLRLAVSRDPDLQAEWDFRVENYAAFAHPTVGKWPDVDDSSVLETISVDLPFLSFIVYIKDGTVRLGTSREDNLIILTPVEFHSAYGKPYNQYCKTYLPLVIERHQLALSNMASGKPTKSVVSFIDKNFVVDKQTIAYWQEDQLKQYLHQHGLALLDKDYEGPKSKGDKRKE